MTPAISSSQISNSSCHSPILRDSTVQEDTSPGLREQRSQNCMEEWGGEGGLNWLRVSIVAIYREQFYMDAL